jgi:hypothetical protein
VPESSRPVDGTGDFDLAFDRRILFNGQPAGGDVALHERGLAQLHAAGGMNISFEAAKYNDVTRMDIGQNPGIGTNRETISWQRYGPLNLSVEV